jgi:outer membrane protein TolC
MSIAFLFLTYDNFTNNTIIKKFIKNQNIYIHPKYPNNVNKEFKSYIIKNLIDTKWGEYSIVDATLNLLKEAFNVTNNIDYQIGENVKTSKELLLKLEKSKALPSLGAAVNFGYNAFGNDFKFFTPSQQWFNYSNLGISLNVPIFSSGGRSSRTQQAKIALEQSKTQLTETEQKLKLQFEKAKSDYEFSIEQLATSKSNLSLAERIENKNQIKFKEGLSSSFDLTKAQEQLYSAQQSYLQAMVDVINKRATLEKLLNKN